MINEEVGEVLHGAHRGRRARGHAGGAAVPLDALRVELHREHRQPGNALEGGDEGGAVSRAVGRERLQRAREVVRAHTIVVPVGRKWTILVFLGAS